MANQLETPKKKALLSFHEILYLLALLIECGTVLEFALNKIYNSNAAEIILVIFIMVMTVVWSVIFYIEMSKKRKEVNNNYSVLNNSYQTLNQTYLTVINYIGYKESYPKLGEALSLLNRLQRDLESMPSETVVNENRVKAWKRQFDSISNNICDTFKKITKKENISVCIKLVKFTTDPPDNWWVQTFIRDREHKYRNYHDREIASKLEENSALFKIVTDVIRTFPDAGYYLSNNVPQERDFTSPSFKPREQLDFNPHLSPETREEIWKLPYKSTLITVIAKPNDDYYDQTSITGFLCLDSEDKNVWTVDMIDIAKIFSDKLFDVIEIFNRLSARVKKT